MEAGEVFQKGPAGEGRHGFVEVIAEHGAETSAGPASQNQRLHLNSEAPCMALLLALAWDGSWLVGPSPPPINQLPSTARTPSRAQTAGTTWRVWVGRGSLPRPNGRFADITACSYRAEGHMAPARDQVCCCTCNTVPLPNCRPATGLSYRATAQPYSRTILLAGYKRVDQSVSTVVVETPSVRFAR